MSKIYFISGHLDLTENEFTKYYISKIDTAIENDGNFIIGDARGADSFAQKYLSSKGPHLANKVTIYHMFDKPRNNFGKFPTIGGFVDDNSRDSQMTKDSNEDILWIRPDDEQKKKLGSKYNPSYVNGTTKNMMRRVETKN